MGELVVLAGTYRRLVGARIRGQWQYRLSFALYTLAQVGAGTIELLGVLVIFGQVPALDGWSLGEVLFLYGVAGVGFTLADLFVSQVERCSVHIKAGTFDQLLTRPLGALFQLSTGEFELRRVGRLLQASAVLAVAVASLPVPWTPARVAVTVSAIASGTVIFGAVWVITSSIAFWTVDSQEVANSFTYGGGYLTHYPFGIFAGWLRRLLVVVPLSFVAYLPATWVLGRDDVYGLPPGVRLASPVVAVATALVARAVWGTAVRHYRSTGS